ncbi:MAG: putative toxin-antitoxin system toxin component, PIN family [Bacteroidota bacterium]
MDTNIIVNAIYPGSKNYWIRKALEFQQIELCITTDILDEYAEIIERFFDGETADLFLSALEILPNIIYIQKYFFWQLIPEDPDDDKFVDCAIASGAVYLVTNDRHFNKLKKLPFPKINVLNEDEFKSAFEKNVGS